MLKQLIRKARLQWFKWWPTTGYHVRLTADQISELYSIIKLSPDTYHARMVQEFSDFLSGVHHFNEVSIFSGGDFYFLDAIDAINFKLKFS